MHTITAGGTGKRGAASPHAMAVTAASLVKLKGTCRDGQALDEPLSTVQAGGNHAGLVAAFLTEALQQRRAAPDGGRSPSYGAGHRQFRPGDGVVVG